jgi:hypothetical protein
MRIEILKNGKLMNHAFTNILKKVNPVDYYFLTEMVETLRKQGSDLSIEISMSEKEYVIEGYVID